LRLLLDTHVLIWWIKAVSGRLKLAADLQVEPAEHGFRSLDINAAHAVAAARLPQHHSDPFDRMLIAQAQLEGLTLVTRDPIFESYSVVVLAA
jgi:PIN domain nuclease of toxin-antitoxin system